MSCEPEKQEPWLGEVFKRVKEKMTPLELQLSTENHTLRSQLKQVEVRMEEAERLLSSLEYSPSNGRFQYSGQWDSEWLQRRDAFLNPKPQDVK